MVSSGKGSSDVVGSKTGMRKRSDFLMDGSDKVNRTGMRPRKDYPATSDTDADKHREPPTPPEISDDGSTTGRNPAPRDSEGRDRSPREGHPRR
jgi:hypothetical protein